MDPFAPSEPPASQAGETARCPRCAQAMDPSRARYDGSGELVCAGCAAQASASEANVTIAHRDPTTTKNLWGAAVASALLGLATLCASFLGTFFFLASPLAVLMGVVTLARLVREPTALTRLGAGYVIAIALCVVGMVFGLIGTGLGVVALFYG